MKKIIITLFSILFATSAHAGMSDLVGRVVIPMEKVVQVRNGKKVIKEKTKTPGYMYVEATLTGEVGHMIKNLPNVIGFLANIKGGHPSPMRAAEVSRLLGQVDQEAENAAMLMIPFTVGETVKVINGPFSTFDATIEKINEEKQKLLEEMFLKKHKVKVKIINTPSKSIRPIFNLCKLNAMQVIKNHISKEDKYTFASNELSNFLGIKEIKKIEGYDVSHISGDNAVASCVVYSKQGPLKKDYRLFNIPTSLSGNDVGSLEHVINRRLKYYDDPNTKPDLILIDGGKTQLRFVKDVIDNSVHNDIGVISIVKGTKRVRSTETIISSSGVVELDKHSKAFLFLQEIRDESHRFALQAQRKNKRKSIKKSELDMINGIGIVLKSKLLKSFGSIKNIKSASKKDLMTVDGISEKIAVKIKEGIS